MKSSIPYLDKYFPRMDSKQLEKIQYDDEGLYSITPPSTASTICNEILTRVSSSNAIVFDAFGGLGGNTFSFSSYFSRVIVSELSSDRFMMLLNNISVLGYKNITTYNGPFQELLGIINYDVIFLDPPWGGKDYKKNDKMTFDIDEIPLSVICFNIVSQKQCRLLVIKLPLNYDLDSFNNIKERITVTRLKKVMILYISCD